MRVAKINRVIEYLDFPLRGGEIKEFDDAKGTIGGYANYKNNLDFTDDITRDGAFRKTIQEAFSRKNTQGLDYLYPYLWSHDFNQIPPGGVYDADEDKKGFYTRTAFNLDTQTGREIYSSFKMGTLKKQSIGYKCINSTFEKDAATGRTIRNLLEIAVMEISAVVFPANDMAQVDTVKNQNRRTFYMPSKPLPKQAFPALTKDYAASYAEATQQDWVSDLWNLWYPLKNEIIVAFQTGDTPVEDVQAALTQFGTALISYVQRGVELDMTEYLQPDDNGNSVSMYMSAEDNPETKAGAAISSANHTKLTKAADGIAEHVKSIKAVLNAAQRSAQLQGYPMTMGADDPPQTKTEDEPEEEKDEATRLNEVRALVYDLKAKLQFQNADHGI